MTNTNLLDDNDDVIDLLDDDVIDLPSEDFNVMSSETRKSELELAVIREMCLKDHLFFTRYFFKARMGAKFRVNWHHVLISRVIDRIISGALKNVVINVSPGSSKTEMVIINLIARGMAMNPRARFLHLSYSDDLALLNSSTAKDLISSEDFQELWPMPIADDSKSKKRWNVTGSDGKNQGGVYATSLGGQITGFRAGHMSDGWQGAILIDDPLAPGNAFSKPKRDAANRALIATVASRKANPDTPIIIIMQRVADEDTTGFVKAGNLPGHWEFIEIPAIIDDRTIMDLALRYQLPPECLPTPEDSPRDAHGRYSYWQYKEPINDLLFMEAGGASHDGEMLGKHVFAGQYMQRPSLMGGNIIRGEWFPRYGPGDMPRLQYRKIYADTAQKTGERNDYSVFEAWGKGDDGRIYLLDLIRDKWEAPDLKREALAMWQKHHNKNSGALGRLRVMAIEDKASGTGLMQDIKKTVPIRAIQRERDKLTRVMDVVSYIEAGMVVIPASSPWLKAFIDECESFAADDSHKHDDQIDPMVDAIMDMLGGRQPMRISEGALVRTMRMR